MNSFNFKKVLKRCSIMLTAFVMMMLTAFTFVFMDSKNMLSDSYANAASDVNENQVTAPSGVGADSTVRDNAGLSTTLDGAGLSDESALPTSSEISGNWQDTFQGKSLAELAAMTYEEGNFYKKAGQGSGETADDPYIISNAMEFAFLGAVFNARGNSNAQPAETPLNDRYFQLSDNIDFAGKAWTPIVNLAYSQNVKSVFDGNNKTLSNIYIDQSDMGDISESNMVTSIFGCWPQGEIKNLTIVNANIVGDLRASVVAASGSGNYNAKSFSNIKVVNSRVVSSKFTTTISDNANEILDCSIENCEVLTRRNVETINAGYDTYTIGIGRANTIKLTEKTAIVSNSIIRNETNVSADALAASYMYRNYVYGVGSNRANDSGRGDVGNFVIEDSLITSDVVIDDFKGNSTDFYTFSVDNVVIGGYRYDASSSSSVVLSDITLDNCEVSADVDYLPTNAENGKNILISAANYLAGIGRINKSEVTDNYKNLEVVNAEILSNIDIAPKAMPDDTASTGKYNSAYAYMGGVFYVDNTNQQAVNCSLTDSKLVADHNVSSLKNSNYSVRSGIYMAGIGFSNSGSNFTKYYGCSVKNSVLEGLSDTLTEEDGNAVDNVISNTTYLTGIGQGTFEKNENTNCSVNNVIFNADANSVRSENDTSSNSVNVKIAGIGFYAPNNVVNFDGTTISSCDFITNADYAAAYVSGVGQTRDYYALGSKFNNISATRLDFDVTANSAYIGAVAVSTITQNDSVEFNNVTVEDIDINADVVSTVYASGVSHNSGQNKGLLFNQINLNRVKMNLNSQNSTVLGVGVSYNSASLSIDGVNYNHTLKSVDVSNLDITSTSVKGGTYAIGLGYNSGSLTNGIHAYRDCSVENANLISVATNSTAYASGLAYNSGLTNNSFESIDALLLNCDVNNATIYASPSNHIDNLTDIQDELLAETNGRGYATGLAYTSGSGTNNVVSCSVSNSNIFSEASGSIKSFSVGLNYVTSNLSEGETLVKDNKVSNNYIYSYSTFGTSTSVGTSFASGMTYSDSNRYINVQNNTTEDNGIYAYSKVSATYASGMLIQTSSYSSRVSDCYALNNEVYSKYLAGGNGSNTSIYAFGLAGYYAEYVENSVVANGKVWASNNVGSAYASGVASTMGGGTSPTRPSDADSNPCSQIISSYNFADVIAETDSMSNGYASGIGQAEYIDSCFNYGDVKGNYAGGITFGFYQTTTSLDFNRYSPILIVKNSTNAGNVCRADNGSTSYVGGIVGVFYTNTRENMKFVIENNASVGGVYSKVSEQGEYSQVVSGSTFLGMLYGYLNGNPLILMTSNSGSRYEAYLEKFSIKNNYMLVTADFNSLFNNFEAQEGSVVKYSLNQPTLNYVFSAEGVFQSSLAIKDEDGRNRYDIIFKDIYKNCATLDDAKEINSNKILSMNYSESDLSFDEDAAAVATQYGWKEFTISGNTAPMVNNESVKKQIVVFDLVNLVGETPNVVVVDKNTQFTTPTATLSQVGVSVDGWKYKDSAEKDFNIEELVSLSDNNQNVVTLYAVSAYTTYTIEITNEAGESDTSVEVDGSSSYTVTLTSTSIVLKSQYTGEGSVNSITWRVQKADATGYVDLASRTANTGEADTLDISDMFNSDFITAYANAENKIVFSVEYDVTTVYTITTNAAENDHFNMTITTANGSIVEGSFLEGQNLSIKVTVDDYYELVKITVNAETYNTADVELKDVRENLDIVVEVKATEYDINIQLINLQNVSLPTDDIARLIENYGTHKITIEDDLPQITANINANGYRFVGWKMLGMSDDEYIASENGTISAGYGIVADDFGRYIMNGKFQLIAVFQRQYTLTITTNNPEGESFLSKFTVNYVDENGETQNISNVVEEPVVGEDGSEETVETILSSGSYVIDENTFVKIYVYPNKRVDVVAPTNAEFGGNIAYVYLTADTTVEFTFVVRPLDISTSVLDVVVPDSFEGDDNRVLNSANVYYVNDDTDNLNPGQIEIGDKLTLSYSPEVLQSNYYRFINVYLKNVATNGYDLLNDNSIFVDDSFFDNYVTDDGQVNIVLKVIKQYQVSIVPTNLVSDDDYVLGSYSVVVKNGDETLSQDSNRFTVLQENEKYLVDTGLTVEIIPVVLSNYANFAGYTGLFDDEMANVDTSAEATILSDRSLGLRFDKNTYRVEAMINSEVDGGLSYTETFQLGDVITFSYTPKDNYKILDWKLFGQPLASMGAVLNGNTVTVVATEDFLDKVVGMSGFEDGAFIFNSQIDTMMNPILFYGLIIGGVVLVLLAGLIVFLVIRQTKMKKQKEEQERKLNDIARKFNISSLISDLKSGKDVDFGQPKDKK